MAIQLIIPGREEGLEPCRARMRGAAEQPPVTDLLDNIEVVHAFDLSQPARAAVKGASRTIEVEDDDILEIEVEGGMTLWTSAQRYQERVALWHPEAISDRGLELGGIPGPSLAERGVKEWIAGALRVLRLKTDDITEQLHDPKSWLECAKNLGLGQVEQAGAWATAKLLMYLIEKRLTPDPGLYRWASVDADTPLDLGKATPLTANDLPKDKPILVFIHGTASRTLGSFGAFCERDASQEWRTLRATFGENIYAFEHRTMSESPIDNVIPLVECLPEGTQLYLVTHSRGGQVGDLLCLNESDLDDARIERFRRQKAELEVADRHDRQQLKRLRDLLRQKRLHVMRIVRVACPARGTLLASDNTDEFLSLLTNLIGYIPGIGQSPIYHVIKRITLEVAKKRTDPALIPGIEVMMPESPLVCLLNAATQAKGELGIIAGDIEGGNWFRRIAVFITDRFIYEQRDNDLVVNNDSMFYGAQREQEYYAFDQGADVSHFNYFQNTRTRIAVTQWLLATAGQPPKGFMAFDREHIEPVPMLPALQKRSGMQQPVVFVLPGFMGSQLKRGKDSIWLDYQDLKLGGLGKIKDIHDGNIKATGLLGEYYDSLCKYLADTHEVLPFAYDWRKSIREAAAGLGKEVGKVLKRTSQPVRFIAHGMGGLVVRRFIADHGDLWEQVCARPGSRFVMLGTPNRGTHAMVETLLGAANTVRRLALLDPGHDLQRVMDIISGFPGALELLPQQESKEPSFNWYTDTAWQELKKANENCGALPAAELLANAQSAVAELPADIAHADRVVYVAGSAAMTPCGAHIDEHGRIMLSSTDAGDGRVTHEAGKLPGVATWYMAAEHGELADHKPAFPALVELLEQGKTTALPTMPPSLARGEIKSLPYAPQPLLYPTRSELIAGFMGKPVRAYRRRVPVSLKVCVVHGDLRYASYPVMVGHYLGDTIIAAEAHLDRQLDCALSQRYQLGIYPGAPGTTAIVRGQTSELETRLGIPRGAVVIGLGRMGDLGTGTLANAVREGALQYALQTYHGMSRAAGAYQAQEIGLSALLIGANSAAAITVEDSVTAMMRALAQANVELDRAHIPVRINRFEIIELFIDVATQAAHAARKLAPAIAEALEARIDVDPELVIGRNGRIRRSQMPTAEQWRRWAVTAISVPQTTTRLPMLPKAIAEHLKASLSDVSRLDEGIWRAVLDCAFTDNDSRNEPHCALLYVAIADRARTEVRVQQRQPELIDKFVQLSIRDTRFRLGTARTLCELLLPNELKDSIGQLTRLVIEVDAETANYPWELMVDGGEPLCVKLGFVRQLRTGHYRTQIRAATSKWAYVVGDPVTSDTIPALPGARAEARLVNDLLANKGYTVEYNPERPNALDVFNRLFAQPYRILHLAGHGYYEASTMADRPARSGMVLEGGLYLTAVEVAQMRHVPDLVFLNCCYLAQMGPEAKDTSSVAYNKLAASLSRELIEMGVRAVVAAGWAVRDDAANWFAKVFYTAMLNGATFGEALQKAREKTWTQYRDSNTWGAYQAYGDPNFRLNAAEDVGTGPEDRQYAAMEEVLYDLGSIRIETQDLADTATDEFKQRKEVLMEKLLALQKDCPATWQTRGAVLYRFARAYSDLGEFKSAIDYYQRALAADEEDSGVNITAAEQLANLEARLGEKQKDPKLIGNAIDRLQHLIALGKTRERLALLGSAYKRLAQVNTEREPLLEALTQSAVYYKKAAKTGDQRGRLDPYHAVNWITIEALLGHELPDAESWLSRCEAAAVERYAISRNLWDAVALPDADIARRLLRGELKADAVDTIIASYREVFTTIQATPREQNSVVSQLKFIQKMLERLGGDGGTIKTIKAILQGLTGEPATTSTAATPTPPSKPKG
ncbi:MAG: CHAT domain-containing protein [Proteobacteria bacterium]|nr:CHAT domain-containing protein [Pseudomonadota bacterium]MBU4296604.1 CHAT domain-containing protein [Pseudomonadota bacterium]MCG2748233.1 CHAT domain-containing protein [Desulfobulbaceae bacterium]